MGVSSEELKNREPADTELELEYEEAVEDATQQLLEKAIDRLKKNALLFNYMSDPTICRTLTKREREVMSTQADQIYELVDELAELVEIDEDI